MQYSCSRIYLLILYVPFCCHQIHDTILKNIDTEIAVYLSKYLTEVSETTVTDKYHLFMMDLEPSVAIFS